jgi:hypothetical protein
MFQQWKESFIAFFKEDRHPHTNMANGFEYVDAHFFWDFSKDGIFMNAVDTGWVTDEDPAD